MNTTVPIFLSINSEKQGPFTHEQILKMHQDQSLKSATLYWQEGMGDWEPIEKLLAELGPVNTPPAIPDSPAVADTPAPATTSSSKKLIIAGYICTVLTLIPLIGYLPAVAAVILGIMMCCRNIILHGVINIVLPLVIAFVMLPIILVSALTLMKPSIQGTFDKVTAELEAMNATKAFPYAGADEHYAQRRATPLTEDERTLIGNWSGKNSEFEWEIMRKADGTYAQAFRFPDDVAYGEDIVYGTWGIEDDQFYYMDLEVIGYSPEDAPEKSYEDIKTLTSDTLVTTYVDEDEQTIRSTEKRVAEFSFKSWDDLDENGRYPEVTTGN